MIRILLAALGLIFFSTHSLAQAPLTVGEHQSLALRVDYLDETSWAHVIRRPDSAYIKISFSRMDLMAGDAIEVSDPNGRYVWTYPGSSSTTDGRAGFWALSIPGDTAVVRLVRGAVTDHKDSPLYETALSGARPSELGVVIDRIARGFSQQELRDRYAVNRSTCGVNERDDVACWADSHPTEFANSSPVARILQNGSSHCTGWRLLPGALLMSNEHCITSQSQLNNMEFWFNYQRPGCNTGDPNSDVTIVTGDQFLIDDNTLDFALVTIDNPASVESFGFMELDIRTPVLGEEIYIPQHGAGNPKEFGIDSDLNAPGNLCQIDVAITNGIGTDTDTGYFCDTTGGSSGSPVLARSSHRVIALHHFGTFAAPNCTTGFGAQNRGVRIDLIWPMIQPFMPLSMKDGFE